MSDLSDNLRNLRSSRDLNQDQLGAILNMSRFMVSAHENGRMPDASALIRYAKFYDVSVDWLLGLTPQRKPAATSDLSRALDALAHTTGSRTPSMTAEQLTDLAKRLRLYYTHGAPAHDLPAQLLSSTLTSTADLITALDEHDDAAVLAASNSVTEALLTVNAIVHDYYTRKD